MNKILMLPLVVGLLSCFPRISDGQNLLTNGNLEIANTPPSWTDVETVTGIPGRSVNSGAVEPFANQPAPTVNAQGIWLRAFAGNQNGLFNESINASLSQTVPIAPGAPGQTYTLKGWSLFEGNYSGGVDLLDSGSTHDPTPMDPNDPATVPSPTSTSLNIEFLDSGGSLIGSAFTLNLKTDRRALSPIMFANDNTWRQHTLAAAAPGTASFVRVTASATNMVYNVDPSQSAFLDNFSLRASGTSTTERLTNGNFNQADVTPGWTKTNTPTLSNVGEFNEEEFGNHTPNGLTGLWLKQFTGTGSKIAQTVPATVGEEYLFSAYAKWEAKYSGGEPDSATQTFMEIAFLDTNSLVIGTPATLDLRADGQTRDGNWQLRDISAIAPELAVSVRVTAGASGMFVPTNPDGLPQGAFFDDLSLTLASAAELDGDFNDDGAVDAADYVMWRKLEGTATDLPNDNGIVGNVGTQHYDLWRTNFGSTEAGSGGNAAVPEPACATFGLLALMGGVLVRSRKTAY